MDSEQGMLSTWPHRLCALPIDRPNIENKYRFKDGEIEISRCSDNSKPEKEEKVARRAREF